MGSTYMFIVVAAIAVIVGQLTLAKEFIIGDDKGWTTKFNYQAWAADKNFRVGDKLGKLSDILTFFKYKKGTHNVFKVDQSTFQQCAPPIEREALTSGNDVITLETPGTKWYLCGIGNHCEDGNQKLEITVFPQNLSPTSPLEGDTSISSARKNSDFKVLVFVLFSTLFVVFQ
ncbi:Uclacyanin [Thalictrum thalictroides]|uniref:Uclacyanin n=1 Tax=Thalictrum thalictroides TaxID=46969 RepID=A0A7J6US69_THATH|nr:Uclacyanin [Thalictrum thalictroides]